MDEKKLNDILNEIDAPAPKKDAQKMALDMALAAFEENNQKNFKGNENTDRPIGITNKIGAFLMTKKYKLSGVSGAVATCAILAVIGVPMSYQMMHQHAPMDTTSHTALTAITYDPSLMDRVFSGGRADKKQDADSRSIIRAEEMAETEAPRQRLANESSSSAKDALSPSVADRVTGYKGAETQNTPGRTTSIGKTSSAEGRAKVQGYIDPSAPKKPQSAPGPKLSITGFSRSGPHLLSQQEAVPAERKVVASKNKEILRVHNSKQRIIAQDKIAPDTQEIGRDAFEDFKDNAIKLVNSEPVSTFSIDVDTASYSFMRRQINSGVLPQKDAIRAEELINYFNYNYAIPDSKAEPFLPNVTVYDSPWATDNKLIHIGIKGYDIDKDEKPHTNLVFLIDTSGSMHSADKLPLLVSSFKLLLGTLSPDDTVAIVTYAGSAGTVLEPTKASDKHKILSALNKLRSGGSTAGAAGIKQAYALAQDGFEKDGVNRVILATDGDFNVGIRNHDELKDYIQRKRETGISLSVLGFGQGNYHDNLMQALAQNGNGNAAYIDSLSEARKVLVEESGSTLFTIAKDVKIQVEFNPSLVSEYRLIGYETRHLNREDFNNDKVDAGEVGAGHSVTAIYEVTPTHSQNKMVDPLRYKKSDRAMPVAEAPTDLGQEYALLKMRYKLPTEGLTNFSNKSQLISRTITLQDDVDYCPNKVPCEPGALSNDVNFATAVAGFAQILRGGTYTSNFSYDDVIKLATAGKGKDEFGYRNEFINLVRLAKSSEAMR